MHIRKLSNCSLGKPEGVFFNSNNTEEWEWRYSFSLDFTTLP